MMHHTFVFKSNLRFLIWDLRRFFASFLSTLQQFRIMASSSTISSSDDRLNTELLLKHISDLKSRLSGVEHSVSQFDNDNYRLRTHVDASCLQLTFIIETFTKIIKLEKYVSSTLDLLHTHVDGIFTEIKEAPNRSNPAELIQTRIRNLTSEIIDLKGLLPVFQEVSPAVSQAKPRTTHNGSPADPSSKSVVPYKPGLDGSSFNYENVSDLIGTLDERSRQFLSFFSVFPVNAVVSKRVLKNWWIGEGLLGSSFVKAEIMANKILEELMVKCFIEAVREQSRLVGFRLHPYIQPLVIRLASYHAFFVFDAEGYPSIELSSSSRACLVKSGERSTIDLLKETPNVENLETLFNINEQYPDFKLEFFFKLKNIKALSLGKWQRDDNHVEPEKYDIVRVKNSQKGYQHIEVESIEFLKGLKKKTSLRLLSLRGISRISELPESLCKQVDLRILDLNSCYNLEDLPQEIGNFKKLTYLDISGCYLLDRMPKGVAALTELRVLKGFLVVDLEDSCTFLDLNGLKKLRKLSIYTSKENFPTQRELDVFQNFEELQNLSIIWDIKGHEQEHTAGNPEEGLALSPTNPTNEVGGTIKTSDGKDDKKEDASAADPSNLANQKTHEVITEEGENVVTPGNKIKTLNVQDVKEECSIEGVGFVNSGVAGRVLKQETVASGSTSVSSAGAGGSKDVRGKTSASPKRTSTLTKAVSRKVLSKLSSMTPGKERESKPSPSQEVFTSLEKLDIQCFPLEKAPDWLKPDNMNSLKRLYIRGGKLKDWCTTQSNESWKVEILRLKFLYNLTLDWGNLQASFPELIAVEKVKCPKCTFPTDEEGLWLVKNNNSGSHH